MDYIRHFLFHINSSFSIKDIFIIILISILMGEFINFTYRITHGNSQDKMLTCMLLLYTVFCSVIIYTAYNLSSIIILLSFIVAGIILNKAINVKYKDSQVFLIWSVACGILNAEKQFVVSSILCVLSFIVFWILKIVRDDMSKYLIIEGDSIRELEVQSLVFDLFNKKAKLISRKSENNNFELIYNVSTKALENLRNKRISVTEEIEKFDGITNITICNEDAINER